MGDVAPTGPTGHSPWGMSVLERRLSCPGSASAEADLPDRPSSAADRGTVLHDAAAHALLHNLDAEELQQLDGDDDGIAIVQPYLDAVRATHARLGGVLLVEHRFHLQSLSPLLWGTSDAVVVAPPRLAVLDLKTGGHRVPIARADGTPNLQLVGYACGAMDTVPVGTVIDTVEIHLVQPRLQLVQSMDLRIEQLFDLGADLVVGIEAASGPGAVRRPGDHCRYCRAAATCPDLTGLVRAAAGGDFTDPADPLGLTPPALGAILDAAELIDVWVGAVRQAARQAADRGFMPDGYKLVERRGRRRWTPQGETAAPTLLESLGVPAQEIYTPPQIRSPAQLEAAAKKAKAKLPPVAWSALQTSTSPGLALVPVTDPRPPVNAGPAAVFIDHPDSEK